MSLLNDPADQLVQVLQSTDLFRDLAGPVLLDVARMGRQVQFAPSQTVFLKGDPGDCFYIILDGQIGITTNSPDGKELLLNLVDSGEVLGEIAMLDGGTRTASAVAMRQTTLLRLDSKDFRPFLISHPDLSSRVMILLCQRLRWASSNVEEAVFLDVPRRLARRILHLSQSYGVNTDDGLLIEQTLSQEYLASMLGVSREMINRSLKAFRASGIISYDRGVIVITNPRHLADLAGETDRQIAAGASHFT